MTSLIICLCVLVGVLLLIYAVTVWKTGNWTEAKKPSLAGLGLPEGSIRALIAFLIVGAFVIFIFFGKDAVSSTQTEEKQLEGGTTEVTTTEDNDLFTTILTAFGTLTGAVTGFYFGTRGSQGKGGQDEGGTNPKGSSK